MGTGYVFGAQAGSDVTRPLDSINLAVSSIFSCTLFWTFSENPGAPDDESCQSTFSASRGYASANNPRSA